MQTTLLALVVVFTIAGIFCIWRGISIRRRKSLRFDIESQRALDRAYGTPRPDVWPKHSRHDQIDDWWM